MDPFTKSAGLKAIIEQSRPPRDSDTTQLQVALYEIDGFRDAIRRAYLQVMLGNMRAAPDDAPLPPEVRDTVARVEALERRMRSAGGLVISRIHRGEGPTPRHSFEAGGVKYLFAREKADDPCFVVAVPLQEFLAFEVDDDGRIRDPERIELHARPFLHLPARKARELRRVNAALFEDGAGHGDLLPSFLPLYTEFVAFAIEEQPAVLGAHLLAKRHPKAARALLEDHAAKVMGITRRMLDALGYRRTVGDEPPAGLAMSGMTLLQVLRRWDNHCCKSLLLNDFAEHFARLHVRKVEDLGPWIGAAARPTPPV
jgi:hypothetical protein